MVAEHEPMTLTHDSRVLNRDAARDPIEPYEIRRVSGETWDEASAAFDGIAQEQLYAFAKDRWPGVKLEPMLFRQDGNVVGGVLMMIQPLPLGLSRIAVAKWGPVLADNRSADAPRVYQRIVETLIGEYADRRGMMLSLLPKAAPAETNSAYEYLKARGFSEAGTLDFASRYIVYVPQDDEAMMKNFGQKWRYHLKKSIKAGLSFEHAGPDELDTFSALYRAMCERKKFANHSAYHDTIEALIATPVDALRPELFFVRHEGRIIAGAIIFKAGDTAVYLYGATEDEALPLRAGYFMQYHVIRWLRDNTGATWYDLGGTDGFQGLHQFKKGLVGAMGQIQPVPPVMNLATSPRARLVGGLAYWARNNWTRFTRFVEARRSDLATPDQQRPE